MTRLQLCRSRIAPDHLDESRAPGMNLLRREFLRTALAAAALPALPRAAWAQAYPTRPVHIVVGYAAGGPTDIAARLIGQALSQRLGQQFVIDNRPGGGSNLATEAVVRASPDGYTLLLVGASAAINAALYPNLSFNFIRDIAPVAVMFRAPLVMVVAASFPAKTVPEFIALAKANPEKLNMASGGSGSPAHVTGELFQMMTGTKMIHVPYRGESGALPDLLGGRVQVMFPAASAVIEEVKQGRLRALAVTTAESSDALSGVPTLGEFVPGYEASAWYGIGAPRNTPARIIEQLNAEINAALADSLLQARLAALGGTAIPATPAVFSKTIAAETEKWGKVVTFSGAKPD
jgi:tripartite-type tricarboxylate transporter receptor subunit TctC